MKFPNPEISNPQFDRALELISGLCDERLTVGEIAALQSLLLGDVEIRRLYVRKMHLHAGLHLYASALGTLADSGSELVDEPSMSGDLMSGDSNGMEESMVLPALCNIDEEMSQDFALPSPPKPAAISDDSQTSNRPLIPPYLKGPMAAMLMLGVGIAAYIILHASSAKNLVVKTSPVVITPAERVVILPPPAVAPPPAVPIATVTSVATPVWEGADMPPAYGNFVAGQTLAITSGDVQLSFRRGGRLVVEGPAAVAFVSESRIQLLHGRIVATIPGGGLTVDCPNGAIKDLGTQFGIDVNSDGATEVQVFQGRVSASLKSTATTQGSKDLLLAVGQAAVITHDALAVDPNGAAPQQFVRSLVNDDVKTLDVTDLISGGDGTTHLRGIGINANTGAVGNFTAVAERNSNGQYNRITSHPVLDGGFIPDGTKGPMVVDSAGDKFDFSPADGTSYNYIFTGGKVPWRWDAGLPTVLDSVDYSTANHALIFMHANNALTLDLNAIRRLYPDRHLTSFSCRVGNSAVPSGRASNSDSPAGEATARVLVNGVLRDEKPRLSNRTGSARMQVSLVSGDRFLTLATTNGGKGVGKDWLLWVDAEFDLASAK